MEGNAQKLVDTWKVKKMMQEIRRKEEGTKDQQEDAAVMKESLKQLGLWEEEKDGRFVMELELEELLYIGEAAEGNLMLGSFEWENEIAKGLIEKIRGTYKKPEITNLELKEEIKKIKQEWSKLECCKDVVRILELSKKRQLEFYYTVLGD